MFQNRTAQGARAEKQFGGFGHGCGGFDSHKFGKNMPHWMQKFAGNWTNRVPVNIEESDEAYMMSVYAAGLVKDNFTISVKDDVLSIAYKSEAGKASQEFKHQEFIADNFERLFQLNTKVMTDSISATYVDGVLKVTLPKNPETTKPAQKVVVE